MSQSELPHQKVQGGMKSMLKAIQRPFNPKFFRPSVDSVRCIHIGFRKMANVASTYSDPIHIAVIGGTGLQSLP
ncbi:hypothetical protein KCU73_g6670, partial [Aureobasidium melanogenum]